MGIKHAIKGILTFIPGLARLTCRKTGGTNSARYCYSVWLRHLIMINQSGLDTNFQTIAELGPGDSIGVGLAALLTGANKYYALDIQKYAHRQTDLRILNELLSLFAATAAIPGKDEFPQITPEISSLRFPHDILTEKRLARSLATERVEQIRQALLKLDENGTSGKSSEIEIYYLAPWRISAEIEDNSVDLIISQAALEHIEDLADAYLAMSKWLRTGGIMSHQIDFSAHGLADEWNGHWAYSDLLWKVIRGKRPWSINRQPYSIHRKLIEQSGFDIIRELKGYDKSGIEKHQLAPQFADISDEDLITRTAYILAVKK